MNTKVFYGILIIGLLISVCIYFDSEIKDFTGMSIKSLFSSFLGLFDKDSSLTGKTVSKGSASAHSSSSTSAVTKSNFASYAKSQPIIKDIPEGAEILLKLYNFNTGERQWETSYIVKKGSVTEGTLTNPEITLILNSKYLADLNKLGFCATVKKANKNGDLGMEFGVSEVTLAWKYRAMMKYKECF